MLAEHPVPHGRLWNVVPVRGRVYYRAVLSSSVVRGHGPSLSLVCPRDLAQNTWKPHDKATIYFYRAAKTPCRRNGNETETTIGRRRNRDASTARATEYTDNVINDFLARCTPAPYCRSGPIIRRRRRRREPQVFGVNAHVLKRNFCHQRYQTHNKLYVNTHAHTPACDSQSYVLFSKRKKKPLFSRYARIAYIYIFRLLVPRKRRSKREYVWILFDRLSPVRPVLR